MRIFILLLLTIAMFWSCTSGNDQPNVLSPQEKEQKSGLVKEVMEIHDEAMPWMDQIHTLKKELNQIKDSLESDSLKTILWQAMLELDSADEAMMAWMRQYREPSDTVEFKSAREYLLNQKNEIEQVKTKMSRAIEKAKSMVK